MSSSDPTPERLTGVWWAAGLLLVLLLPNQLWLHQAAWASGPERVLQDFALGAAYIAAVGLAATLKKRTGSFLISTIAGPALAFGALYLIYAIWLKLNFSSGVAALALALTMALIALGQL